MPAEPSWGRVLVTTVRQWTRWHLRHVRIKRLPRRGWLAVLTAIVALAALGTLTGLQLTGAFTGTSASTSASAARSAAAARAAAEARAAARASAAARSSAAARTSAAARATASSAAAAVRQQAATWVASQISDDATIACQPQLCTALQAQGVSAGRLTSLPPAAAHSLGASVLVGSDLTPFASQAPAVIASFGTGADQIQVRAAESGGAAGYASALRADLAMRESAGTQLLRNFRIQFSPAEAAQIKAGQVDSRLLTTLASLASQYGFRVGSFGDSSPGAAVLYRQVTITAAGKPGLSLSGALAMIRAQEAPYVPSQAAIVRLPGGQAALSIEFGEPSPLGVLSGSLGVYYHQPVVLGRGAGIN